MISPRSAFCWLLVLLSLSTLLSRGTSAEEEPFPVLRMGEFLLGATVPKANLQRSTQFLDVDRLDKHLQVALVVDGTDSMQQDLESLQQNLQGLLQSLKNVRKHPVPTVSVALIVYRDTRSPDGPVAPLIAEFEARIDRVNEALQNLQPQNGAPFFREAVDQGLHYALSQLDWRPVEQAGVSRWIIVAGDAPPYPEGTPFRQHTDQELIDLARERQIAIYGMAVGSAWAAPAGGGVRAQLRQTAMQERPDLKTFLGKLARETGGHTVDILQEETVRYWMTHRLPMRPITEADIAARRLPGGGRGDVPRIAVLPHLPLAQMDFASDRDEVVIAAHLRQRLARLGSVDVVAAEEVRQASAVGQPLTLKGLAAELQADYLIWGAQKVDFDYLVIESGLYSGESGERLAGASESVRPISDQGRLMILNQVFRDLCQAGGRELEMRGQKHHAEALREAWSDEAHRRQLMAPLARDQRAQSAILAGLDELERSLAFVNQAGTGPATATAHLNSAQSYLETALQIDSTSPYAHLLLANCLYNLQAGGAGQDAGPEVAKHLRRAHELSQVLLDAEDPVRLEITAQHALLISRDVTTAVTHFRKLAGLTDAQVTTDTRTALRAHWMLAGIHLGDWGAISWGWDHVDPEQARERILTILAEWPDSPEAAFYQQCLDRDSVPVGEHQLARTF